MRSLTPIFGAWLALSEIVSAKETVVPAGEAQREILTPKLSIDNVDKAIEGGQDFEFRAETERLMDIIINSLYTERDVALRELISNAADAIEKVRVSSLKDKKVVAIPGSTEPYTDYKIQVQLDKKNGILSIIDTGIGMTRQELEANLGTVAKSGTDQFMEAAKRGTSASNLIGQFGVGFYSAFLIADEVTVISKSPFDDDQHVWHSTRNGRFQVARDTRVDQDQNAKLKRGTIVSLKLKEDAKKSFTDSFDVAKILKRFSSFIPFPIYLGSVKDDEPEIKWRLINENKPLWLRDKSEISPEEYESFYKSFTKDFEGSAAHSHFKAEGDIEFTGLFYIPNRGREDVLHMEKDEGSQIKLYVQRVLISDSLENFFPNWMSFVRGLVDANDLPLKIDRETFSQSRVMRTIKSKSLSKVFEMLKQLSKDADSLSSEFEKKAMTFHARLDSGDSEASKELMEWERTFGEDHPEWQKWNKIWSHFSGNFMLGCLEPTTTRSDRNKILDLFRGISSKTGGITTLATYVSRLKPGQEHIYYITGDEVATMKKSPYMEFFLEAGIEVLMLTSPFDEGCVGTVGSYKDHKFVTIEKNSYDDGEFAFLTAGADKDKLAEQKKKDMREKKAVERYYKPLADWIQEYVGLVRAQYVVPSQTLVLSPAMISSPQHGMTATHEKMARSSLGGNRFMMESFARMKNFEFNPKHPLIHHLLSEVRELRDVSPSDKGARERAQKLNETIDILYESAMIHSGFPPRQPHIVMKHLYDAITGHTLSPKKYKDWKLEIPKLIYDEIDLEMTRDEAPEDRDDDDDDEEWDDAGEYLEKKDEL